MFSQKPTAVAHPSSSRQTAVFHGCIGTAIFLPKRLCYNATSLSLTLFPSRLYKFHDCLSSCKVSPETPRLGSSQTVSGVLQSRSALDILDIVFKGPGSDFDIVTLGDVYHLPWESDFYSCAGGEHSPLLDPPELAAAHLHGKERQQSECITSWAAAPAGSAAVPQADHGCFRHPFLVTTLGRGQYHPSHGSHV